MNLLDPYENRQPELATGFERLHYATNQDVASNLPAIQKPRAVPYVQGLRAVTLALTMRKPFDVLAEGLLLKNSRGDWTPIELFAKEADAWDSRLHALLEAS